MLFEPPRIALPRLLIACLQERSFGARRACVDTTLLSDICDAMRRRGRKATSRTNPAAGVAGTSAQADANTYLYNANEMYIENTNIYLYFKKPIAFVRFCSHPHALRDRRSPSLGSSSSTQFPRPWSDYSPIAELLDHSCRFDVALYYTPSRWPSAAMYTACLG